MLVENEDYELIPIEKDHWNIRILTGPYTETVIQYGNLTVKEDMLHYDFSVESSPDVSLTPHDETLQVLAGEILSSILEDIAKRSDGK
jgi:hypothetical protein